MTQNKEYLLAAIFTIIIGVFFWFHYQKDIVPKSKNIIVNVKDFGAKGDGVTNDYVSVQKALRYIEEIGGGTLYFPNATYVLDNTVKCKWMVDDGTGMREVEDTVNLLHAGSVEINTGYLIVDGRVYKKWNNKNTIRQINKTVDSIYKLRVKEKV